jgi:hypothetical protein
VTPAAHRYQQALRAREADRMPHISNPIAARHQRGTPVDVTVPDPPGSVVTGIAGADQLTPEHLTQGGRRLGAHLPDRICLLRTDSHYVPSLGLACSPRGLDHQSHPMPTTRQPLLPGRKPRGLAEAVKTCNCGSAYAAPPGELTFTLRPPAETVQVQARPQTLGPGGPCQRSSGPNALPDTTATSGKAGENTVHLDRLHAPGIAGT